MVKNFNGKFTETADYFPVPNEPIPNTETKNSSGLQGFFNQCRKIICTDSPSNVL